MELDPSFKNEIFNALKGFTTLQEKFDFLYATQLFCEEHKRTIVDCANIPFAEVVNEQE